jgi:hypothetical protein
MISLLLSKSSTRMQISSCPRVSKHLTDSQRPPPDSEEDANLAVREANTKRLTVDSTLVKPDNLISIETRQDKS